MSNRSHRLAAKLATTQQEPTVVARVAKDVDQAKLASDCKPDDLVAWNEAMQRFTRLPLANAIPFEQEQSTLAIDSPTIKHEIQPMTAPIIEELTPANARRLKAAQTLLADEFHRVAANKHWGSIVLEIPFKDGDAQDTDCTTKRKMRVS